MRNLILIALLSMAVPAIAETRRVERADGTVITYYLDRPKGTSFPIVTILQGSECLKVSHKYAELIEKLNRAGCAVLRVEKPGLTEMTAIGDCPEEYLRLNTVQRRVLDLCLVMAEIRQTESLYNGGLAITGGSEGAMVAALAAPLFSELQALVLYSGGGASTFGEEVLGSVRAHMEKSKAPIEAIEERLRSLQEQIQQIRKEPVSNKEWLSDGELGRNTYLWWANAWDLKLSIPLKRVRAPILAWQGDEDESVLAQSAVGLESIMRDAGKDNFELRHYKGGHAPTKKVFDYSLDWIEKQLNPMEPEALQVFANSLPPHKKASEVNKDSAHAQDS